MISVFQFDEYRAFLKKQISEMPKNGYGQSRRLADHLGVHTTLVSQILTGLKDLNFDQAVLTSEFFGLNELESEFFVALVQMARAGNESSRKMVKKRLTELKSQSSELKNRVKSEGKLSEEQRAIFYADWSYTAVRQLSAIPKLNDVETIAKKLNLSIKKVRSVTSFLISAGLCRETKGRISPGPASTHVDANSPWSRIHHTNWRELALRTLDQENQDHVHYTSPMTLSRRDAKVLRELILKFIESVNKVVDPSPSEILYCLNIDWFEI